MWAVESAMWKKVPMARSGWLEDANPGALIHVTPKADRIALGNEVPRGWSVHFTDLATFRAFNSHERSVKPLGHCASRGPFGTARHFVSVNSRVQNASFGLTPENTSVNRQPVRRNPLGRQPVSMRARHVPLTMQHGCPGTPRLRRIEQPPSACVVVRQRHQVSPDARRHRPTSTRWQFAGYANTSPAPSHIRRPHRPPVASSRSKNSHAPRSRIRFFGTRASTTPLSLSYADGPSCE